MNSDQSAERPEAAEPDVNPSSADSGQSGEVLDPRHDGEPETEVEVLKQALDEADQRAAESQEAMLRMQAEMENLRKRLIRDLERSRKRALEGVMGDLLPVRDSMERALEAATDEASVQTLREGNALIIKMLSKVLHDHGLQEIDPKGEPFNPEWHEAISLLPSPEHAADTVIDVVQKGFKLNDHLIRPARVVVSSGAPGQ